MANEITVLRNGALAHGGKEWSTLLYFDLSAPADAIVNGAGTRIAVQNSSQVPAAANLSAQRAIDIDAGNGGFLVYTFIQSPGEAGAAFLSRAQAAYSVIRASWLAEQKAVYENQGDKHNST